MFNRVILSKFPPSHTRRLRALSLSPSSYTYPFARLEQGTGTKRAPLQFTAAPRLTGPACNARPVGSPSSFATGPPNPQPLVHLPAKEPATCPLLGLPSAPRVHTVPSHRPPQHKLACLLQPQGRYSSSTGGT